MQQQANPSSGNEIMRARALEAARAEINELRELNDEQKHKIQKLS